MKQRVNLSLTKNLYKFIRRSHKNVSSYVEKLIVNDIISRQNLNETHANIQSFPNPVLRSFFFRSPVGRAKKYPHCVREPAQSRNLVKRKVARLRLAK